MKAIWKTKEMFGKENRKEDEACGKENENKDKQRKRWKQQWKDKIRFLNWFLKQDKRKLMATNY